jgi:hypothetical protein
MPQHRTGKTTIKAAYPEVEAFATYLDQMIKSRTSENKFLQAAGVGKTKLSTYLEGIEVPDKRVLEYYFRRPLEGFRPLSDTERQTLWERYRQACGVQDPKEPTPPDKVNFLEEDLAQARAELADLTERLKGALKQKTAASVQVARMRQDREILRAQLQELTAQASALQRELEDSEQDHQAKMEEASRKLAGFDRKLNDCHQELDACHQTISALETALREHIETSIALQKALHSQHQENRLLRQQIADERRMWMKIVVGAMDGQAVARLSDRLERSDRTIARQTVTIQRLAETNQALERERDLVTQERDFLRAAATSSPISETVPDPGPTREDFPYAAAIELPRPREPHQHRGASGDVGSPIMEEAWRAQFAASPAEGTPPREVA